MWNSFRLRHSELSTHYTGEIIEEKEVLPLQDFLDGTLIVRTSDGVHESSCYGIFISTKEIFTLKFLIISLQ